jgi:hypothetical protein
MSKEDLLPNQFLILAYIQDDHFYRLVMQYQGVLVLHFIESMREMQRQQMIQPSQFL